MFTFVFRSAIIDEVQGKIVGLFRQKQGNLFENLFKVLIINFNDKIIFMGKYPAFMSITPDFQFSLFFPVLLKRCNHA